MEKETYGRGIPTKVDVETLIAALGIPKLGDTIEYEKVEEVLKLSKNESRFGTVTAAWRRLLEREHNLVVIANRRGGYEVLDNSSRINFATGVADQGYRRVARAGHVAMRTETKDLTPQERKVADHLIKVTGQVSVIAAASAKTLGSMPNLSLAHRVSGQAAQS